MFSIGYFYVPGSGGATGGGGGGTPDTTYATKQYVDQQLVALHVRIDDLIDSLGGTQPTESGGGAGDDPTAPAPVLTFPDWVTTQDLIGSMQVIRSERQELDDRLTTNLQYQQGILNQVTMGTPGTDPPRLANIETRLNLLEGDVGVIP